MRRLRSSAHPFPVLFPAWPGAGPSTAAHMLPSCCCCFGCRSTPLESTPSSFRERSWPCCPAVASPLARPRSCSFQGLLLPGTAGCGGAGVPRLHPPGCACSLSRLYDPGVAPYATLYYNNSDAEISPTGAPYGACCKQRSTWRCSQCHMAAPCVCASNISQPGIVTCCLHCVFSVSHGLLGQVGTSLLPLAACPGASAPSVPAA